MPDLKNQTTERETEFTWKEGWIALSGTYTDPIGNRWRIDVVGDKDAVVPFVEQKPFSLTVRPFRQEQADPPDSDAPEPAKPGQEPSEEAPLELPSLAVTFTVEALADGLRPPYNVAFEIDPCMVGNDNYDSYQFCLQGGDTIANVSYISNGGRIHVSLFSSGRLRASSGTDGTVNVASAQRCWCFVGVRRLSGVPCYTLSGDITVN